MSRTQKRPIYIFALNTNDPMEHHILLDAGLSRNQFKIVQGMYNGKSETSYVVDEDFSHIVTSLAIEYKQESILYVDEIRDATLIFRDNKRVPLGKFKAVHHTEVKGLSNYTIDPTTGYVYTTEVI